jgi:hypothetical protein
MFVITILNAIQMPIKMVINAITKAVVIVLVLVMVMVFIIHIHVQIAVIDFVA